MEPKVTNGTPKDATDKYSHLDPKSFNNPL